jgi:protocatechuate 3,4-dioxygenase beta subunit
VRGDAGNERDQIWRSITDLRARDAVTIPFMAVPASSAGELTATFDIVLGLTPPA